MRVSGAKAGIGGRRHACLELGDAQLPTVVTQSNGDGNGDNDVVGN